MLMMGMTLVVSQWCRDAPASSWLRAFARIACCLAFFNLFLRCISKLWEQRLCMSYGWQIIPILYASGNRRFHVDMSEWLQGSNNHKAKTQFPWQAQVAMRTVLRVETSLWPPGGDAAMQREGAPTTHGNTYWAWSSSCIFMMGPLSTCRTLHSVPLAQPQNALNKTTLRFPNQNQEQGLQSVPWKAEPTDVSGWRWPSGTMTLGQSLFLPDTSSQRGAIAKSQIWREYYSIIYTISKCGKSQQILWWMLDPVQKSLEVSRPLP